MKKVININFQGRVIPIEESAYDILKQYIESLRRYFANEESREEIINDIESRIGELFAERLKKGATCITDDDVNAVIVSMGRPEELEAEDAEINGIGASQQKQQSSSGSQSSSSTASGSSYNYTTRGRLFRNADDKIIAGVCSGLANYMGIDPVIMRIVFVVLFAPLFWVYILLWVIIPSTSMQSNVTKRLYRSAEDKVVGGVCGGLAAYFNLNTWVPRLIFALPLVLGLISGPFNWWWNDFDFFWAPKVITGGLGGTLLLTYIVLWIAVPVAVTSAEKLEMRGERVDLNSIRNTVKEDLESFKSRAQNWGNEVKETAQQFGEKAKDFGRSASSQAKTFSTEAGSVGRRAGSGIGHIIGVLFKAFFMVVGGCIALALFAAFVALLFTGFAFFPLKDFIFDSPWNNLLAWFSLFLFLGIPLVAMVTWFVRRIIGVRSRNHYLGFIFGGLWTVGLISVILLLGSVGRNLRWPDQVRNDISMAPVKSNKLVVDVKSELYSYYGPDWFFVDWDDWFFYPTSEDTVMLNTIRVDILASSDSDYHTTILKRSHGRDQRAARESASKIDFPVTQTDSLLVLPRGFAITRQDKWRNQHVLVKIEVPVGKRIILDRSINDFEYFEVNYNNRRRKSWNDFDDDWNSRFWLEPGIEYIMTQDGPKRVAELDPDELAKGNYVPRNREENKQEDRRNNNNNNKGYRYQRDSTDQKKDSLEKTNSSSGSNTEAEGEDVSLASRRNVDAATPMTFLRLFQ
jgi:phage shock protein PspC (stress-responsive transcriptional regulator)